MLSIILGNEAEHSSSSFGLNVYALDAPHEARSMRSSGVGPVNDHPSLDKGGHAFTVPLGYERPMACLPFLHQFNFKLSVFHKSRRVP